MLLSEQSSSRALRSERATSSAVSRRRHYGESYMMLFVCLSQENGRAVPVLVVVALSGVKVCDPDDQSVRMVHALRRISYATCESARALFALVAREPRSEPPHHYCHAFQTDTPEQVSHSLTLNTTHSLPLTTTHCSYHVSLPGGVPNVQCWLYWARLN
ncbi:hypothetical protein SFRURICE_008609 [Spodoptera frugiperda]|uniref:SFRICE_038053 n=1 Tax=Spodoptera frugiperda TaxID=7108 RepID=A0A2H1WFM5_SPOFR|nr:hypothetical protein SFRURICE_008609 [Spodoptera frugiperda]